MKEDIERPKVENVTLAVTREVNKLDVAEWKVYLLNENPFPLDTILISSRGYGEKDGEKQETSTLRHYLENLEADSAFMVEPIQPELFHLNNEYWVSYYVKGKMYDKRFVFLPESIHEDNLHFIEMLNRHGVLHS
jgi:hypothetical protein